MAQLFFEYGVMASGKSIEILKVTHNYAQQNRKVLLLTSSLDDRTKVGEVSSRVGLKHDADIIYQDTNLETYVLEMAEKPEIVLIDEAQFMTREQVIQLTHIVDDLNIPVMAFGLKNDFSNHLFPGSEALLIFADKLEEIKTLDTFGTKKATMNLRIHDGKPVYEGDQIEIGGDENYLPVSRYHYFHPNMDEIAKRFHHHAN